MGEPHCCCAKVLAAAYGRHEHRGLPGFRLQTGFARGEIMVKLVYAAGHGSGFAVANCAAINGALPESRPRLQRSDEGLACRIGLVQSKGTLIYG